MIKIKCLYCHSPFETWEARIRQGKGKFCSMSCAAKYHRDNKDGGYEKMFKNGHPTSNSGRTHFTTERLKGKRLSREHIQKVKNSLTGVPRPNQRGPLSPHWKGGITIPNKLARTSADFLNWRMKVFEQDDWTCQICEKRGGRLHAHHIKMFSKYPSLRFEVSNGVTVCEKCHKLADQIARIIHILGGGAL